MDVEYIRGAQLCAADYAKNLHGVLFWFDPLGSAAPILVKIYKKNGGSAASPSVAIMDACTHAHMGYYAIKRLYWAHRIARYSQVNFFRMLASSGLYDSSASEPDLCISDSE